MGKLSYAGFLDLSSGISSLFTFKMRAATKNCEKNSVKPLFGGLRSFKVIDVDKSKKPLIGCRYSSYRHAAYHNKH